ncbi:hypothetical protein N7466_010158 [Penicillium verhagenii]|uniref:uncharacterized protein n=1 Tax=Penicillium verhagenii TaxID=1562060 RepID=UPI0025456D0B|nr:uncharacterized protein N7466_010158 [Penicillium verhagenii]KAJ5919215.1 hypothetical protein N7466_010158 [Penicillium verhagenii]
MHAKIVASKTQPQKSAHDARTVIRGAVPTFKLNPSLYASTPSLLSGTSGLELLPGAEWRRDLRALGTTDVRP